MKRTMKLATYKQQSGSFLIEALVSILLFMIGLIALLGVSAQAVNQVSQSKYRNDASYLASELIGEIWVTPGAAPAVAYIGSAGYADWQARVAQMLPSGAASAVLTGSTQVSLDISWADIKDPGVTHHYQTTAEIAKNF